MKFNKIFTSIILSIVIALSFFNIVRADSSASLWKVVGGYLDPVSNSFGLKVSALSSTGSPCLTVSSTGVFATTTCSTGGGGGGADGNWVFFNNSGIRLATTSNQIVIGASSTTTTDKINIIGGVYTSGSTRTDGSGTYGQYGTANSAVVGYDILGSEVGITNGSGEAIAVKVGGKFYYGGFTSAGGITINGYEGNVGIGTSTPTEKLSVNGKIYANNINLGSSTATSTILGKLQVGTSSVPGYTLGVGGTAMFTQNQFNTRTSYNIQPTTATRNNFTGSMGYGFTVDQPTLVTELGRLYVAGNTQNHKAYLWDSSITSAPLASTTIYASYTSDSNNFKWATVTPQRLEPGTTYIVAIDETNGGDTWKDSWAQTTSWQPNFNYAYQAYYTGSGGYPNNQSNTGLGYNTVAMKHKVLATLDVDTVGSTTNGIVLETPYEGYLGGTDYYPMIIKGTVRGSTGTRYMTTIGENGNTGINTNAYISINGADEEYPANSVGADTVFMLGINSDVQPSPAFVIRSSSGPQIKGVSQTSGISGSGATDVNTWNINYDGGGNFMGSIGIGTSSPYSKLSVAGQVVVQNLIATSTTATSTLPLLAVGTSTPTNSALFAVGTSTPALVVNQISGSVGVGIASPTQRLAVNGTIGINGTLQCMTGDACDVGTSASTNRFANGYFSNSVSSGSSGSGLTLASPSADMKFSVNSSERARITTTGLFGIATTSPWKTLSVVGTMAINGLTAAGSTADAICLNSTTKEVLVNTGLPTCTVSSERAKANIESLGEAMSTINSLRPVSFELKEDGAKHIGFIAEEVKKVDDRFVFSLADGTSRGVRYEDMVALLAKGMQEQDKKIKLLEEEINRLKN